MKRNILLLLVVVILANFFCTGFAFIPEGESDFIKWVDCKVPYEILRKAYYYEQKFHNNINIDYNFAKALAFLATKNGNKFSIKGDSASLDTLVYKLEQGSKIDDFYGENKYYNYYKEAYGTIFAAYFGEYTNNANALEYGLVAYHPFAKGFWYNHYDDFGVSRSYGFKRKHLGHDMMGSVGTPIIAVEGGTIAELGWNRYGGWRIGIRSFDGKRSYYYAHLRKNTPYIENLKKGDTVQAGQVIGYLGVTGYSLKENSNMTTKPHLHIGMQLIFDETQVQGPKEIWIDMYQITKFLSHNSVQVAKNGNDYKSINTKTLKS